MAANSNSNSNSLMHPSTSTVPRSHPDSSPNSTSSSSNPSSNIATPTPTIIEDSAPKTVEQKEMLEEETQAEEEADSQTIVVDWDGPDDSTNPKKYVHRIFLSPCYPTFTSFFFHQLVLWS